MPNETMKLWEDPTIVLEAAKSAISLANKMHEFAYSLNALAVEVKAFITVDHAKSRVGDWEAQ